MQASDVVNLVQEALPGSDVEARFEGSHVHLVVVSELFEGKLPVKRQQMVYAALNETIASGAIHAVHMQTATPAEKTA